MFLVLYFKVHNYTNGLSKDMTVNICVAQSP